MYDRNELNVEVSSESDDLVRSQCPAMIELVSEIALVQSIRPYNEKRLDMWLPNYVNWLLHEA